jgi:hypothetical protein
MAESEGKMNMGYWVRREEKALKTFEQHIKVFQGALEKYHGGMDKVILYHEAQDEFIRLLPRLPLHPGSRRGFFNQLMPVLGVIAAAHKVLKRHGYSVKQFGRLEYEGYRDFFSRLPRLKRKMASRFMLSPLFCRIMNSQTAKMKESGDPNTFHLSYTCSRKKEERVTMECTRCGMMSFMEDNNLEELKHVCNVFDFAQAEAFGFGLVQPQCLGRGDNRCVYYFKARKEDTVLPENLTTILKTSMVVRRD